MRPRFGTWAALAALAACGGAVQGNPDGSADAGSDTRRDGATSDAGWTKCKAPSGVSVCGGVEQCGADCPYCADALPGDVGLRICLSGPLPGGGGNPTANTHDDTFHGTGVLADFDGTHTCDPSVLRVNGVYYMYYGGISENAGQTWTRVGVAKSENGLSWTRLNGGKPIVDAARNPYTSALPNNYGAGQPTATFVDGLFYLQFTDTTGLGGNQGNGAGQYVLRSPDPVFQSGVEELSATGFVPYGQTPHTGHSLLEAYGSDLVYADALDGFLVASVGNGIEVRFFDKTLTKQEGMYAVPAAWTEEPAVAARPDHHAMPGTGAIGCLRQRKAVGIVLHPHLTPQPVRQIGIQPVAVQRVGVGVLHQPGRRADHAGNADADTAGATEFGFSITHQIGDGTHGRVVAGGCGHTVAQLRRIVGGEGGDLDLGAAEINAEPEIVILGLHGGSLPVWAVLLKRGRAGHTAPMSEILLDVKGMNCPLPVLRANRALRAVEHGEKLRVLATDRAAVADFQAFCRETGHQLLAWSEESGVYQFVIRKKPA